jgi:hypothetical protein
LSQDGPYLRLPRNEDEKRRIEEVAVPVQLRNERILNRNMTLKEFVKKLANMKTFSLGALRRTVHKLWRKDKGVIEAETVPNYADPKAMFDPRLFIAGDTKVECNLKPLLMIPLHLSHCSLCKPYQRVMEECYFHTMMVCINNGWSPPINVNTIKPRYGCQNSRKVLDYKIQTRPEMEDMIRHKVVELTSPQEGMKINPLGVVIKGSDLQRARTLVNIEVKCSRTLQLASESLIQSGHPKIKCRISTDCSGSGINRSAYSPPFQYSTVSEGLKVVHRNGYLATGDVSRYFFEFPWAEKVRKLFCFIFFGQLFHYLRLCFGFTSCPYYCSTWSAEFGKWFGAMGIVASFLMDDWLVGGSTEKEARLKMNKISDTLTSIGFTMAKEKSKVGQKLVWLGIHIDTTTMTIRIDPLQSKGFLKQLLIYEDSILRKRNLDLATLRHISGKLNWYAEVVSAGRLHIRSLWDYTTAHPRITEDLIERIVRDFRWWRNKLETWSIDRPTVTDYRILNGEEILQYPDQVLICQSDASGTDGYGYAWSTLEDTSYQWYSARWKNPGDTPAQSHEAELRSLHHFVLNKLSAECALVIWITDSESACWTINKGHCADPRAWPIVEEIYERLDSFGSQVVALWVPREDNTLTDFLSHFAYTLNRDFVEGVQEGTSIESVGRSSKENS